jgi:hypothetical protein
MWWQHVTRDDQLRRATMPEFARRRRGCCVPARARGSQVAVRGRTEESLSFRSVTSDACVCTTCMSLHQPRDSRVASRRWSHGQGQTVQLVRVGQPVIVRFRSVDRPGPIEFKVDGYSAQGDTDERTPSSYARGHGKNAGPSSQGARCNLLLLLP